MNTVPGVLFFFLVTYKDYIVPNDLSDDTEYFSGPYMLDMLQMLRIPQEIDLDSKQ
jgi:hypothetical protein